SATIGPSDVFFAHLALRGHGSVTGSGTRARLRLSVSPRRVRAGTSRRFSFRVVTGSGRSTAPVPGATVSFASQLVKTNTRGRARIRARFTRRGLRKARARKSGFVTGLARVRVLAGRRSGR
ncbi:MAG: hypothetical protein QOD76_1889, partial [Solirubrobacteraceae bacterium]|nr:hypothetical protein [Solirubrobacteraceae bacterium]